MSLGSPGTAQAFTWSLALMLRWGGLKGVIDLQWCPPPLEVFLILWKYNACPSTHSAAADGRTRLVAVATPALPAGRQACIPPPAGLTLWPFLVLHAFVRGRL